MARDRDFLRLGRGVLGLGFAVWFASAHWGCFFWGGGREGGEGRVGMAAGWCWERKVEGEVKVSCLLWGRGSRVKQAEPGTCRKLGRPPPLPLKNFS